MRRVLTMLIVLAFAVGLGQAASLDPNIQAESRKPVQIATPQRPDTLDYYVLGYGDNGSGYSAAIALASQGYGGIFIDDSSFAGHPDITPYRSVWVFVPGFHGTNTNYTLMQTGGSDETLMLNYLNAGGRMYFEHCDWGWAVDPNSGGGLLLGNLAPIMGPDQQNYNDYVPGLNRETGVTGHFTQGMSFAYDPADTGGNGGLCDLDELHPITGAFEIFTNNTGQEAAIAYDNGTHRTVVSPFLFHGLTDASPPSTKAVYADSIMHFFGIFAVGVEGSGEAKALPKAVELGQARPNPMSRSTEIRFGLPSGSHVSLKVYDLSGRQVSTLVNGQLPAGYHQARWDSQGLPGGVYFYRLEAGNQSATRKLVLVR